MTRRLRLAPEATDDIERMKRWYAHPGAGPAAQRRVRSILAAIRHLRRNPCRHRRGDHPGTRQLVIEEHVVIYEVDPDTGRDATAGDVQILRVFGPGQARDSIT